MLSYVAMSAALNVEDPGPNPVPEAHTVRTLRMLREEPWRGRVVVLADAETLHGYVCCQEPRDARLP
jgi:hypothetical protein